jgi:hypothetical protein
MVVVDGRARPSCIFHSLKKVKPDGYLVIDNSEREYYLTKLQKLLAVWEKKDFYGPVPFNYQFSQTTIFQKRKA